VGWGTGTGVGVTGADVSVIGDGDGATALDFEISINEIIAFWALQIISILKVPDSSAGIIKDSTCAVSQPAEAKTSRSFLT
jgi:hypothetical protein